MPRIAVIYYSSTGHVRQLAAAVQQGAESASTEVRLRRAGELAPEEVIRLQDSWHEHHVATTDTVAEASNDDLEWADGYALGTPTRYGLPSSQLKQFIDHTGPLWATGKLADKLTTSFTSAQNRHGGQSRRCSPPTMPSTTGARSSSRPATPNPLLYEAGGNPCGTSYASGDENSDSLPDAVLTARGTRDAGCRVRREAHRPTIDRQYFHSVYFHEPSGVLFELASRDIGFDVDEPLDGLGTHLLLPPQHEHRRDELEQTLTRLPA